MECDGWLFVRAKLAWVGRVRYENQLVMTSVISISNHVRPSRLMFYTNTENFNFFFSLLEVRTSNSIVLLKVMLRYSDQFVDVTIFWPICNPTLTITRLHYTSQGFIQASGGRISQ